MLTRQQLQLLTLEELQELGKLYNVQPIGSYGKEEAWINVLSKFPYKAIDQMKDNIGIKSPGNDAYLFLTHVLTMIGEPTESQNALLRATQKGERLDDENWEFYQMKMYELYRIRLLLQQIISLLAG